MAPREITDFTGFRTSIRQLFEVLQNAYDKEKMQEVLQNDEKFSNVDRETVEAINLFAGTDIVMSFEERLKGLSEGRYDVIAYGILATSKLKDSLLLTSPIVLNKQVLVQRKENGENDSLYIRNQLDLARRTLHVVKGSPSILRIQNLGNEIGDTIYIKEIEKYGPEQLISLVAHGDIDYAVCDESIARAVADSLSQIDINTAISFTQFYSWAVSRSEEHTSELQSPS